MVRLDFGEGVMEVCGVFLMDYYRGSFLVCYFCVTVMVFTRLFEQCCPFDAVTGVLALLVILEASVAAFSMKHFVWSLLVSSWSSSVVEWSIISRFVMLG
ncbi:hypothetical protein Dimus_003019 [Dionaea muscipula]